MTQDYALLKESLLQLIAISEQIMILDLEDDDNIALLEKQQLEQEELKARITTLLTPVHLEVVYIKNSMKAAYDAELQVNLKLKAFQDFISMNLNKIQEASRMKNLYHQAYSQAEGYFFDRKK
jgi:hypothetical protein